MILENQKQSVVLEQGETNESIGMSLDLDSAQILMQMLSKNLYSDPIGSTVRECASNALDSHRRAGTEDPIIVFLGSNEDGNYEFSVEDFGIGLDADDVKNIISKYGKSTKRLSNNELGMMGLGFKSPLAYASSFYFICRKNGVERKYMMYEGEDVNTIDLLYEKETSEKNGVKVIVPIIRSDYSNFHKKIKEQLSYFENVYFNVNDISNSFQIFRGEDFQISELVSEQSLHLCLDNVYYPLDFGKLGISRIYCPIALRFSLSDGIFPTPNRESIRYTQEAIEAINKKIVKVSTYLIEKFNETIENDTTLFKAFDFLSGDSKIVNICGKNIDVNNLERYSSLAVSYPKVKGIDKLDLKNLYYLKDYIFGEYAIKYLIFHNRFKECKHYYDKSVSSKRLRNISKCFLFEESIKGKKKEYLKDLFRNTSTSYGNEVLFIKKVKEFKLGKRGTSDYETYYSLLKLNNHPKSEWRERIVEFQNLINSIISEFTILENVEISQEWIDARKKVKTAAIKASLNGRKKKLEGEINGKKANKLERWVDGKNCKWVPTTFKLNELEKQPSFTIYSDQSKESLDLMDKLYKITRLPKKNIEFVAFSDREFKNFEKLELHNWIKLDEFMKGKNKTFKRLVTAYLISNLIDKNSKVFKKKEAFCHISTDLYNKLTILDKYFEKNYTNACPEVYESMLEVANENNLFDYEVYDVYLNVEKFLSKMYFFNDLFKNVGVYLEISEGTKEIITSLLKYHKIKLDWKKYNIKLNDEVITSPIVEEDVTEQIA